MADRLDLTALPRWSYCRVGVPDLIATEKDLCLRAMLDLMREQSLNVELRIEDVPIDPLAFVQNLHEWSAANTVLRLHEILDPILAKLEGDEAAAGAVELATLARGIREMLDLRRLDADGACD